MGSGGEKKESKDLTFSTPEVYAPPGADTTSEKV